LHLWRRRRLERQMAELKDVARKMWTKELRLDAAGEIACPTCDGWNGG